MISVLLDVFSGKPNPQWLVSDNDYAEIYDLLMRSINIANEASSPIVPALGYRGVVATLCDSGIKFRAIHGTITFGDRTVMDELGLESRLLSTAPPIHKDICDGISPKAP